LISKPSVQIPEHIRLRGRQARRSPYNITHRLKFAYSRRQHCGRQSPRRRKRPRHGLCQLSCLFRRYLPWSHIRFAWIKHSMVKMKSLTRLKPEIWLEIRASFRSKFPPRPLRSPHRLLWGQHSDCFPADIGLQQAQSCVEGLD
jgi:hypothetical protein